VELEMRVNIEVVLEEPEQVDRYRGVKQALSQIFSSNKNKVVMFMNASDIADYISGLS